MTKIIELRKLTDDFYKDYPAEQFPEIEHKIGRPYAVLLVRINSNKFAIPFRTNIRHRFSYRFKKTGRNTMSSTGIDFSKAILVVKESYLGNETNIDDKEYLEIQEKCFFIVAQFKKYVDGYVRYKKRGGNPYLEKRYRYSTLQYFDNELLKD